MSSETKVWFSCSSGLGLSITEHALQKGDRVVATLRKLDVLSELAEKYPETLLLLRLDVTKPDEVTAAFAASQEKFGRIDVVVNNAGIIVIGELESTPDSAARDIMEVNFWGASHVTREAVRFFREVNKPVGGRLLQVSSIGGIRSSAASVYYCASKFAFEALSEGLAEELHPDWNIKVTILEPAGFRTKGSINIAITPVHPAYTDLSLRTMQWRNAVANPGPMFSGDPAKFAEAVYRAAYLEDPPLRLPIHISPLAVLKEKGQQLLESADKWESWSADVSLKN